MTGGGDDVHLRKLELDAGVRQKASRQKKYAEAPG